MRARSISVAALVALGAIACASAPSPVAAAPELLHIQRCIGEVVPICASVRIFESGTFQYVDGRKRTRRSRLTERDLQSIRQRVAALDVASYDPSDRPNGPFVRIEVPAGAGTFETRRVSLPDEVRLLIDEVDRSGRRLYGKRYEPVQP